MMNNVEKKRKAYWYGMAGIENNIYSAPVYCNVYPSYPGLQLVSPPSVGQPEAENTVTFAEAKSKHGDILSLCFKYIEQKCPLIK